MAFTLVLDATLLAALQVEQGQRFERLCSEGLENSPPNSPFRGCASSGCILETPYPKLGEHFSICLPGQQLLPFSWFCFGSLSVLPLPKMVPMNPA